jgi:transcriptional regulator with XRE-family HTH domain
MYFEIGKKEYISPGTIGGKIKRIREHLGLSQKQLGLRCGFSEATADVRIRQYESNKKVPRETALKKLCSALEIEEHALFDADLLPNNAMYHALFDIEDFHGLHPVQINGRYYLEFSGPTVISSRDIDLYEYHDFLKSWITKRNEYLSGPEDSEDTKYEKRKKYDLWRYEYPMNEARETSERLRMLRKKEQLEQELRELNDKLDSGHE